MGADAANVELLDGLIDDVVDLMAQTREHLGDNLKGEGPKKTGAPLMRATLAETALTGRLTAVLSWLLMQKAVASGDADVKAANANGASLFSDLGGALRATEDTPAPEDPNLAEIDREATRLFERVRRLHFAQAA